MIRYLHAYRMLLLLAWLAVASALSALTPHCCHALCATVKIEIKQELTLERQAFDAHMRINNGLSSVPIEDVSVSVSFLDEDGNPVLSSSDPDNTSAAFFIRLDSMDNIENVEGTGSVAPETSADIHWLIIPAPGASNGLESGTLYFVGATLTYTALGQSETIEVTPDYIYVKPMPQLVLDYFLPADIYGDDAWSTEIEAPVPFFLGLRISNEGDGYARSLKVESAQPQIVGNETGLLIGFQIEGTSVNGAPATKGLTVDFGDIAPKTAGMARWIMSCTLSGRFVDFSAEFSHADELGGKLTSLIAEDDVRTHFLVHSVFVDAEGRDTIEDFLANDDDIYRVFESDNVDTEVTNQSTTATLSAAGAGYRLTTPPTAGFMYARVSDPGNGGLLIKEVIRSDGKRIKSANAWFSKTRTVSGPWQYFLNIFDYNTTGIYTITTQSAADVAQAPVIAYLPERTRVEGQQLSFLVEASDPNGTIPELSAERLPVGATFVDQGDGSGIFNWVPAVGQAGRYSVKFIAGDGVLESSRQAAIRIFSQEDSDGDGMLDSWEIEHFGTLALDGTGDFDGDGISDLDEFLNGLDPELSQSVPSVPEIIHPGDGEHIHQPAPELIIAGSSDPEGDDITYTFELYADEAFKELLFSEAGIPDDAGTTGWTVPESLADNSAYYWRVRASDATGSSNWAYGRFFTDTENDPPSAPGISSPEDGFYVDSFQPVLEITNARDPDGDPLTYGFEVYADSSMSVLVTSVANVTAGENWRTSWGVDVPLEENTVYYWRAVAADNRGAVAQGPSAWFRVDTANTAPPAPLVLFPPDGSEITSTYVDLSIANVIDPNGDAVTYFFELDTDPAFNSAANVVSDQIMPMEPNTIWSLEILADNTRYYWRVKSSDGSAQSEWTTGSFFVNTINEAPPAPELKNPGYGAWVATQTPTLSAHPVEDVDADSLSYRFEIYSDAELVRPVGYAETNVPLWEGLSPLPDGSWYYWRVQAVDSHGIPGNWSETGMFFVKLNGIDLPPQLTFLWPDQEVHTNAQGISIRWSDSDPDSNAAVALYYDTDENGADGEMITGGIPEDPDGTEDYYEWDISGLEGTYYIYAIISDAVSSQTVYAPASITVDHTPPVVSALPAGGSFSEPVAVSITTDEPGTIYYTLDGGEPDINAAVYSEPLTIAEETTLRFMAVDTVGNQCAAITESYLFEAGDITVTAVTDKDRLLAGLRVYAFTDAGSYTGIYTIADGEGRAYFDPAQFADGSYRFRLDYLGSQFWSQPVGLPDTRSISVVIPEDPVTVTVATAAGAAAGVRVYLFSETGAYLGLYATTDADGQAVFDLPVGMTYSFRADLYGNQYWSSLITVSGDTANMIPVDAGGGRLLATVTKGDGQPITGVSVYLFNTGGSYLGQYAVTNEPGQVSFDLPAGDYRLRTDYLGYQFWSADIAVTTDTTAAIDLAHQTVQVTVEERFQQDAVPAEAVYVYLFSEAGSYLGIMHQTDAQGHVTFELPQKAFQVRVDYLGRQYWSETFTWLDPTVVIPLADARITVTGAGYPLEDLPVYLFSETNSYLGRSGTTDIDGRYLFRLPEGSYLFRADYQGGQFWSAVETLAADQTHDIGITTGGGTYTFTVFSAVDQPLAGVAGYVFNGEGSYLGLQGVADDNGQLSLDLSDGTYQIRIDYLGYEFRSEMFVVPDVMSTGMTIPHTPVDVSVLTGAGPPQAVRVCLFSTDGAYQGRYLETDELGQVHFSLPSGVGYMFRADMFGRQYWSDPLVIPESGPVSAVIDAGGGPLQLTVQDGDAAAMPDLAVYLYSSDTAYLGQHATTDNAGQVVFDVPGGGYKLRVDYLGYSHWTEIVQVLQDGQVTLTIDHQPVAITVQGRYQATDTALSAIGLYLFSPTGSYLGRTAETDAGGVAVFNLPADDYLVRADYLGAHYWSTPFSAADQTITIPMARALVDVTGAGLPREGVPVFVFSESGAYLGIQAATNELGQVVFQLPAGIFRFRADYQSNQYWSGPQVLVAHQPNDIVVSVGGGTFSLTVRQDDATPMAGVPCYAFNESGSYLGLYGATDEQGDVRFDLADGTFQFRADHLGYQHWSQTVTVPDQLTAAVAIPHQDVTVTFDGIYLGSDAPFSGQHLYLYTDSGSYTGINHTTDENGQAVFRLPDQPFKIRADYLGGQYWSQPFQSSDIGVQVPQGSVSVHVHDNSTDVGGARIYLFSTNDTYLGRYAITDSDGRVAFILPEGGYRFRADVEGVQHWTSDVQVLADQVAVEEIDVH
jgi:hypothetical protein